MSSSVARILYHHRTRAQDAQGIHIRALCNAFKNLGHDVKQVGLVNAQDTGAPDLNRDDDQDTATTLMGVEIPHLAYELMALGYNGYAFGQLAWNLARYKPDLVYERYSMFTVGGLLAARLFKVPFVLEVNAPLSQEQKEIGDLKMRGLAQRMEDWLCRNATTTVVVTEAMKEIFVERGLPADRFVVMPNGVDRQHFNPTVDGAEIRQRYGLEGNVVAGFVGWIRPWHGVDMLINAFAAKADALPKMKLLIVGDGPAIPDLKKQTEALGLSDRVIFSGPVGQEEVPAHLAAMDMTVQPNVTDYASPIKLFEYLAMGKAVIALDKPNIREVVEHGQEALLFEPGNTAALADCLEQLYNDEALRQRLADASVAAVERRGFFWENNAARVVQLTR